MHPQRKQTLMIIGLSLVLGAGALFLLMWVLSERVNFFYTPTEIATGVAPQGQVIRGGGMVKQDSVNHDAKVLQVRFVITDFQYDVTVAYQGILPDLFREGSGAVVKGRVDEQGVLQATEVLAKHDETYMPSEVRSVLEAQ